MHQRRRRLLQLSASAVAAAVAGCAQLGTTPDNGTSGDDGDGGSDPTDTGDGSDGTSDGGGTPTARPEKRPPGELSPPAAGADDAGVTVTVFEDLRCPHCRDFHDEVVPQLRSEYIDAGDVRMVHRDFPVVNQWSVLYALGGRSVQAQVNDEGFFAYLDTVFARQAEQREAVIRDAAAEGYADPETTISDVNEETYRPTIETDQSAGSERGVDSTPTVFVGDSEVAGTYEAVASAVDEQL
jgi:protein-disulfide isomerase